VAVPAVYLAAWLESLRPVRAQLLTPLTAVFRDGERRETERALAADLLADYAADQPEMLADLLMDAEPKQFAVLYSKLQAHGEPGQALLQAEVARKLPPDAKDDAKERLAKRQANAAVALLRMEHPEMVWPLLRHSPDPRGRSYLVDRLAPLGADPGAIVRRLGEEPDVTIRRALILSLGEFPPESWGPAERRGLLEKMQDLYRSAEDPGVHAAAEWLLRTWKQEAWLQQVNDAWAKDRVKGEGWWVEGKDKASGPATRHRPPTTPGWYVTSQGQTMVVIPGPVDFAMGSPPSEEGHMPEETQHKRRIGRTFAVAAKPVTVGEFRRFLRENRLEDWFEGGGRAAPLMKKYSPDENGPIILVDWYRAAQYCNWLSQQERIPEEQWCYETNAGKLSQEEVSLFTALCLPHHPLAAAASTSYFLLDRQPHVTAMKKNYLGLRGYRLPTGAEMEYACRAGAVTSRYYGEAEELLHKYGWYRKNSKDRTWPVGGKKPNDLGLFDTHGNVWNWCQERYREYPRGGGEGPIDDNEDVLNINNQDFCVLRGGSFYYPPVSVRSAFRLWMAPATRYDFIGLRAARTFTAE
jgi:formylglycine-generating enzyme required for sulfatase activity